MIIIFLRVLHFFFSRKEEKNVSFTLITVDHEVRTDRYLDIHSLVGGPKYKVSHGICATVDLEEGGWRTFVNVEIPLKLMNVQCGECNDVTQTCASLRDVFREAHKYIGCYAIVLS